MQLRLLPPPQVTNVRGMTDFQPNNLTETAPASKDALSMWVQRLTGGRTGSLCLPTRLKQNRLWGVRQGPSKLRQVGRIRHLKRIILRFGPQKCKRPCLADSFWNVGARINQLCMGAHSSQAAPAVHRMSKREEEATTQATAVRTNVRQWPSQPSCLTLRPTMTTLL